MPTQSDYDFGNALVELDLITLDRVREGLRVQTESVEKGQGLKSLEQVLLDKGYITSSQVALARMRMKNAKPADPAPQVPSKPPPSSAFDKPHVPTPLPSQPPSGPINLPGFQILQKVGSGGAGDVFSARQLSMDRIVAVKVLPARLARDPKYTERFVREARAAAKLNHPNIITAHDVGEHQGTYYMVMEFIDGPTLERLLQQRGVLDEALVANIGIQIARALDVASRNSMVHRDVKPSNIMLLSDGTAKLCDLGLARAATEDEAEGKAVGTPRYISPEQAKDDPEIDIRSDLYSLGATMYHLVTGEIPFPAESRRAMMVKHVQEPVVPPRERRPGVGNEMSAIIVKLMEKDKKKRFQKPADLIAALEGLQSKPRAQGVPTPGHGTPIPRPPSEIRRPAYAGRRSGIGASSIAMIAFFVVFIGGALFLFKDQLGVMVSGPPGVPKPPPGPRIPKPPPGTPPEDLQPLEELEIIAAYASKDPGFDMLTDLLKRYDQYIQKYRGRRWEAAATERRREYLEKADTAARLELASIREKEKPLRTQEKFRDILKLYENFPAKFLDTTATGDAIREEIANLTEVATVKYLHDKAELEESIRQRKYTEALAAIAEMEAYALPPQLVELSERQKGLERLKKDESNEMTRDVRDKYLLLDPKLRQEFASRKYRTAILTIRGAIWGNWKEPEIPYIRPAGADYDGLQKALDEADKAPDPEACRRAWNKALALIDAPIGDPETFGETTTAQTVLLDLRNAIQLELLRQQFIDGMARAIKGGDKERYELVTYPGDPGHFERRTSILWVVAGKKAIELDPWMSLLEPDIMSLVVRSYADDRAGAESAALKDPFFQLRAGLLYFYSRAGASYSARAMEHLDQAARNGVRGVRVYLGDVSRRLRSVVEEESKKKYDEAQMLLSGKQYAQARVVLEELARLDSKFVKEHRAEIEKLLSDIVTRYSAGQEYGAAYKARVEPLDGGRIRVTYDFEQKAQADMFETLTLEKKLKGKWLLERGCMESFAAGGTMSAAMRWRPKVKGDIDIEYDIAFVDEPQNVVVDLFYDAGKPNYYAITFGLDFVPGDMEDRMQMPKTAILKYPIDFARDKSKMPAEWDKVKKRFVGSAAADLTLKKGLKMHVKISRVKDRLYLAVDNKVIWDGDDADYKEGSVVFFSDSHTQIDNLQFVFKP